MDLLLVRHAEPARIERGDGPADPLLTDAGREQAERLADWLALERVDAVLSSPQRRARETAAPIGAVHGIEVEVVDGLVEYDWRAGHYIPTEELMRTNDWRFRAMIEGRWEEFGGENAEVFRRRVAATVDEVIARFPGRRVVAVCHGGVINVAVAAIIGLDRLLWFEPAYTSLTRVVASRGGVRSLVSLNETAHLTTSRGPA